MPMPTRLTDHLHLVPGAVHTGILTDGAGRALLIDPGAANLPEALQHLGVSEVAAVLLTHHHPAQYAALDAVRGPRTEVLVPHAEHALLADPGQAFWSDPRHRWHVYHARPHAPVPARGIAPTGTLADGDTRPFGPARLLVSATPGHTDGSLSYLIEVDGRRVAFVGDALAQGRAASMAASTSAAGPGQVPDAYSLQQGGDGLMDYHGFLGARDRLLAGLQTVLEHSPDTLVASLGGPMDPSAVHRVQDHLRAAYAAYLSGSAGRYYFPKLFTGHGDLPYMPDAATEPAPAHVRHVGTTYVLTSESGEALVLDCGDKRVVQRLRQWQRDGSMGAIQALWISHYHDDHVDAVPDFLAAFPDCPVLADARLADVLERPAAYRLPCQSPHAFPVTRRLGDGETWQWREFTLTARFFPGQTLYHGALLAEGRGHRLFFIGDAFTPTGLDDYCAYNRNLLREDGGYARCLRIVREHNPVLLFNCHVEPGFRFAEAQLNFLEGNLAERRRLFGRLLPWPDPDFGLDSEWARAYPYQQSAQAGATVRVEVRLDNHAREALEFSAWLAGPAGWGVAPASGAVAVTARAGGAGPAAAGAQRPTGASALPPHVARDAFTITIPGRGAGALAFEVTIPAAAPPGRYVLPFRLRMGERDLGPFGEALLDVT